MGFAHKDRCQNTKFDLACDLNLNIFACMYIIHAFVCMYNIRDT